MDFNKHIYEGWTIADFIEALEFQVDMIMQGNSYQKPFTSRKELANWCKSNQPYFKKEIPEVVEYFAKKYNLK